MEIYVKEGGMHLLTQMLLTLEVLCGVRHPFIAHRITRECTVEGIFIFCHFVLWGFRVIVMNKSNLPTSST